MKKTRIIVDVPPELLKEADARFKTMNISRNEGIRRALAKVLEEQTMHREDAFALWTVAAMRKAGRRSDA